MTWLSLLHSIKIVEKYPQCQPVLFLFTAHMIRAQKHISKAITLPKVFFKVYLLKVVSFTGQLGIGVQHGEDHHSGVIWHYIKLYKEFINTLDHSFSNSGSRNHSTPGYMMTNVLKYSLLCFQLWSSFHIAAYSTI